MKESQEKFLKTTHHGAISDESMDDFILGSLENSPKESVESFLTEISGKSSKGIHGTILEGILGSIDKRVLRFFSN